MQTYQIRTTPTTTSLPQTVVMTSPVTLTSQTSKTDDPQLKREIRLMKNRYVRARGPLRFGSVHADIAEGQGMRLGAADAACGASGHRKHHSRASSRLSHRSASERASHGPALVSSERSLLLVCSREAARECRRKKKEYVKCLENRVAVLENQNKTLIEELKTLKDLYCHKSV